MSLLHDELAKLKAAAGNAFNFADPEAYMIEREHAFQAAVVDAVAALEQRVKALEPVAAVVDAPVEAPAA